MFTFQEKEKENEMVEEPTSHVKQTVLNYSRQKAKAERGRKISHLRQVCASQAMHWQLPF